VTKGGGVPCGGQRGKKGDKGGGGGPKFCDKVLVTSFSFSTIWTEGENFDYSGPDVPRCPRRVCLKHIFVSVALKNV